MSQIILFELPLCPHCLRARRFQEELFQLHPSWRDIPLRVVDESRQRSFADSYDYYYVPAYFVDGKKVHEGRITREDVERVFRLAGGGD